MKVTKHTNFKIKGHSPPKPSYHYEFLNSEVSVIYEAIRGVLENGDGLIWIREIYSGNEVAKWSEFKNRVRNLKEKLDRRKSPNALLLTAQDYLDFISVIEAKDRDLLVSNDCRSDIKRSPSFWPTIDAIIAAHNAPLHKTM